MWSSYSRSTVDLQLISSSFFKTSLNKLVSAELCMYLRHQGQFLLLMSFNRILLQFLLKILHSFLF